jgi:enoyl-CoA hydratase
VKKSYRFEQGFTFELNLSGVSDDLRDDFVTEGKSAGSSGATKTEQGKDAS